MNGKQKGDIGQNCSIGILSKFGLGIAFPLSDNYPFDFIIIAGNSLFKAQVKSSSRIMNDAVTFSFVGNNFYTGNKRDYNSQEIDVMICYDLRKDRAFLFSQKEIVGKLGISIRYTPPKNHQSHGVNLAETYEISKDRIAQIFDWTPPDWLGEWGCDKDNYKIPRYQHVCKVCQKEFANGQKNTRFCSVKCRAESQQRVVRPSKEELGNMLTNMSWRAISRKYGVSDNAIKKWAKSYAII